jgi:NACHT domain
MAVEAVGLALGKALITPLATEAAGKVISGRQDEQALERAVDAAWRATVTTHRGLLSSYDVNPGFLEHEGAEEIARVFLPGQGPDARRLAAICVRSLGGAGSAKRHLGDALEEPFEMFLEQLTVELGRYPRFLSRLHEVESLRSARPGNADEREFLVWLIDRFSFLQTAGIGTTKHLQLKLREVFVDAQALREQYAGVKWHTRSQEQRALMEDRLRNREISEEEYEALLDRLSLEYDVLGDTSPELVSITEAVRSADRVLVLGDPGTGKTTLLRHLALSHAQALLDGSMNVAAELGQARLPLYVRAGDFARSDQRNAGLGAFIAPFMCGALECPVERGKLEPLIAMALRAGRCLVLLDGLDEVTSAADRANVVTNIADFVVGHHPRGNRFVCTSRVSGYAAAPLPPEFAAVRLVEMDDPAIERFLRLYVLAIERAEAPSKNPAVIQRDADRTVDELLDAFRNSPGVRRLAANPLLLTALLLVHRTHGALPERRVDAYKAVTDALGHTWRAKQGVPEAELPDERRLTLWLTRLADWMHAHRPEGSATLRDLLEQWGPLWAKLQREEWDPSVLDDADLPSTEAASAILEFLDQIERHSGLLIERAPRRWGFPHLTFEEFYAGRALAFQGQAGDRAARMRARLHHPRYDEPIRLALGLIGRDQPEELEDLFEAALLARGERAQQLDLHPSDLEDLLGRDFRFALRALADDIPASPMLVDELLDRAIKETLEHSGPAKFTVYRHALLDRIDALTPVSGGARVAQLVAGRIKQKPLAQQEFPCRGTCSTLSTTPNHHKGPHRDSRQQRELRGRDQRGEGAFRAGRAVWGGRPAANRDPRQQRELRGRDPRGAGAFRAGRAV